MCSRSRTLHGLPAVFKFPTSRCPVAVSHSQSSPKCWCLGRAGLCSPPSHALEDRGCAVQVKTGADHTVRAKGAPHPHRPRGPHGPSQPPARRMAGHRLGGELDTVPVSQMLIPS